MNAGLWLVLLLPSIFGAPTTQRMVVNLDRSDVAHPGDLPLTNQSAAWRTEMNSSLASNKTLTPRDVQFLNADVGKGILIGLVVGCPLFAALLCFKFCKKRLAKRRMKNFQQQRRKGKRTRDDKIELCVTDPDDVTRDEGEGLATAKSVPLPGRNPRGARDAENDGKIVGPLSRVTGTGTCHGKSSPPRSLSSGKSCATVLENLTYDDIVTSVKVDINPRQKEDARLRLASQRPPEAVYDVGDTSPTAVEYMNVGSKVVRPRRREHPYETIAYDSSGVKIVGRLKPPPSPIQIKRQSKSEDVTIFPFNPDQPNYEDIDVKPRSETTRAIPKIPEPSINKNTEPKLLPKPGNIGIASRSSMCVNPTSTIEPSPYLQRTWSAPNTATLDVRPRSREAPESPQQKSSRSKALSPKLRLSKNKIKARIAEVIERKEELIGELSKKNEANPNCPQLRHKDNRFYCEKPRMRRRIKRKIRKKRRVLDERRRIGIQRLRSRDDSAARGRQGADDDATSQQEGHNRWPLPGVYFESSSGSGSDVWRFRSPLLRSEAYRDAAKREASLLEDIWCHLDEITQRANRIKESYSSRRASDSLSSLSDDIIIRHNSEATGRQLSPATGDARFATRDSTSDRGYYTYKYLASGGAMRRVMERQRRRNSPATRQRPHSCVIMTSSGMSTLTDTGTGAWMSSTATRCSSFSSSRNNSLFDSSALATRRDRFDFNRFVIPKITFSSPSDVTNGTNEVTNETNDVSAAEKRGKSYLSVLDLYLGSTADVDPIYEQLSNCLTPKLAAGKDRERPLAASDSVRVKGDKASYAVITKRACVQEATYVEVHHPKNETIISTTFNREINSAKQDENVSDSERTSDTIRNGSVGSIDDVIVTQHTDVTRSKQQPLVERSSKNYVVVAPSLSRKRLTSSDDSAGDVKSRGDVSDCAKPRGARGDEGPHGCEDNGLCVFMEMSV